MAGADGVAARAEKKINGKQRCMENSYYET